MTSKEHAPVFPAFVCPRCRGPLSTRATAYECDPCAATYPIVLGIPDFRVEPDPWISIEDDRNKAIRLHERTPGLDLASSVNEYWAMTPGTPAVLAKRFVDYVMDGEARATEWLDAEVSDETAAREPWIEIGCASGDLLAVTARRGIAMVGVDVAMRWLVLARRRAALSHGAQLLVCANAEHLPFAADSFAHVRSIGTLEHCGNATAVLSDSARVLRPRGSIRMRTTNRYSLLREPHVNVWGVGFLPRRWADSYVHWRSGQRYLHHHPRSPRELRRALRQIGFRDIDVRAAKLLDSDRRRLGSVGCYAGPVYQVARRTPGFAGPLRWIAPLLDISGRTP